MEDAAAPKKNRELSRPAFSITARTKFAGEPLRSPELDVRYSQLARHGLVASADFAVCDIVRRADDIALDELATGPPSLAETRRKLELLARMYLESPRTHEFPESIRQQHRSMFGLTIFEDFGVSAQSIERSRSGLIVTETLLGVLNFDEVKDFTPDQLRQMLEGGAAREWAPYVYAEWKMVSPERTPGRWWAMPVLNAMLAEHPASTIRTILIGSHGGCSQAAGHFPCESQKPHESRRPHQERRVALRTT